VADVIAAARRNEPAALAAMEEVGMWLGVGLAGLVNILNPAVVVLGGLFERIHPLVADRLEGELDARALRASRDIVSVVPGVLGVDAPLLGAAELAFEPFLADPAARLGSRTNRPALASA
jgi:predicted NBD/HSP70 family sugar kinase